jgi:hypothetical protein
MFVVLTRPPVATGILEYVHRKQFGAYLVAAFRDTAEAVASDTLFERSRPSEPTRASNQVGPRAAIAKLHDLLEQ